MAVKDIDFGWNRINRDLKSLSGSYTNVGLPFNGKVEAGTKKGSKNKTTTDYPTLLDIAFKNEFGSDDGKTPPRPAIRFAFDFNKRQISGAKEKIVDGILSGKTNVRRGLGLLGEFMTAKIKRSITTLRSPANAAITIVRKKSANPLIDHSTFRNSITHVEVIT